MSTGRRRRILRKLTGYGLLALGGLVLGVTGVVVDGVARAEGSFS